MTADFRDDFSADYREARAKFLAAAEAAGVAVQSYRNPAAGPDGQPLYTDVARLGPAGAERVMVVASSTHGVEGFAGSPATMRELLRADAAASGATYYVCRFAFGDMTLQESRHSLDLFVRDVMPVLAAL